MHMVYVTHVSKSFLRMRTFMLRARPARLEIVVASFNVEYQDSYRAPGFFSYWLSGRPYCCPTFDVFGH